MRAAWTPQRRALWSARTVAMNRSRKGQHLKTPRTAEHCAALSLAQQRRRLRERLEKGTP